MAGYFSTTDLDRVRVLQADPLPIPEAPFASQLRRFGLDFPGVSTIGGITFDHLIAVRVPLTSALLFHELVHVAQYRLLGVDRFSRLYVRGFLQSGSYEGIPLERSAYDLESRFNLEKPAFSVEDELRTWIEQDRF